MFLMWITIEFFNQVILAKQGKELGMRGEYKLIKLLTIDAKFTFLLKLPGAINMHRNSSQIVWPILVMVWSSTSFQLLDYWMEIIIITLRIIKQNLQLSKYDILAYTCFDFKYCIVCCFYHYIHRGQIRFLICTAKWKLQLVI